MRLYLIGMPGCGKTTLGKRLARETNYKFIDLDSYIEKKEKKKISDIFKDSGEDYFRELESKALLSFKNKDNVIISTGGGIIKNKANKDLMNGLCVYLSVPVGILEERTSKSKTVRPLLKTKTIVELYNERKDLYDYFKDIEVLNVNLYDAISQILKEIIDEKYISYKWPKSKYAW